MAMKIGIARASANSADICGDMAHAWPGRGREVLMIADGLGHGRDAAVAAAAAVEYIGGHLDQEMGPLFQGLAAALAPTRGAAVGVAMVEPAAGRLTYAAVGNTRAAVFGWQAVRLDSAPGIVGRGTFRLTVATLPVRPGSHLVLWSDGVEERLSVPPRPDPAQETAALARALLEQYLRGGDDACVLVARIEAE